MQHRRGLGIGLVALLCGDQRDGEPQLLPGADQPLDDDRNDLRSRNDELLSGPGKLRLVRHQPHPAELHGRAVAEPELLLEHRRGRLHLPVQLSCANQPTYSCAGPPGNTYGNSGYPTNCGNPNATCTGNTQNCVNAYFHPMFVPPWSQYQPNAQCPAGSTLLVRFLPGS